MNLDKNTRINCTYAEFPYMCRFTVQSLTRDLPDFEAHSPMFGNEFLTQFKTKTDLVGELMVPMAEVKQQKIITAHIAATMKSLIKPVQKIEWYVEKIYSSTHLSPYDFGIVTLRKALQVKDVELVTRSMQTVKNNIILFGAELAAQGLSKDRMFKFNQAYLSIIDDKVERYNWNSTRRNLLQANKVLFAGLYAMLCEIQKTGKLLYTDVDPVKATEYTFYLVMKSLRRKSSPDTELPATVPPTVTDPLA